MTDLPDEAKTETVEYEYEGETRTLVIYDHDEVKSILRACLQAYEDPETAITGEEMVRFAYHLSEEYEDADTTGFVAALRRLLDPTPHEEGDSD